MNITVECAELNVHVVMEGDGLHFVSVLEPDELDELFSELKKARREIRYTLKHYYS